MMLRARPPAAMVALITFCQVKPSRSSVTGFRALSRASSAALLWMAAGFALPWALEAGARAFGPGLLHGRGFTGLRVAAEVGFAALVFHSVAEGLALVAALAQPQGQLDLEIALVAHHAPLTAAVVLPFLELRGPRSVAMRAAAVGASGVAPEARLMPIRLAAVLGTQAEAEAFVWAADHGADVISCSWGPLDGDCRVPQRSGLNAPSRTPA